MLWQGGRMGHPSKRLLGIVAVAGFGLLIAPDLPR
jgi:hypothetical protein